MKCVGVVAGCCLGALLCAGAQGQSDAGAQRWVGSWAASQQAPEPMNGQPALESAKLTDATLRQVVRLSIGGEMLRVHLSNAFGTRPLTVDSVHVARPGGAGDGSIDVGTDHAVTFAGESSVTIPIGAEFISDPVKMKIAGLSDLAISFHLAEAPAPQSSHVGSRETSYLVHGEHAGDAALPGAEKQEHWYQIAAVDVAAGAGARAVVAFGDSITDGHGSTTNGNDRWTDVLARRLQGDKATREIGVLNEGISGNHLLTNGLGENALQRMDRDVLALSGVKYVFVFEGINDVGMLARGKKATAEEHAALRARMIAAYEQIVLRAHAQGLKVIGATMTPFVGSDYYFPTPENEADRQAVNAWIRGAGHFDAVVDFDAVVRDPKDGSRMLPAFDCGDHLHPGPVGYKAMGDAVGLGLFR